MSTVFWVGLWQAFLLLFLLAFPCSVLEVILVKPGSLSISSWHVARAVWNCACLLKPRTKCTHSCPLYIISLIIHFSHSSLDWGESPTVRTMALWFGAQISFLVLALFSPRRWIRITPALQISLLSTSMSPFLLPVSNLPLPLLCKGNCEYIENPPE